METWKEREGYKVKKLHIMPNEKFTELYIEFINNHFDASEHLFLIIGKGINAEITARKNVKNIYLKDIKGLINLIKELNKSKKVFLHGLFMNKIVMLLFLQPWTIKKCNWIIWGGDLYKYSSRNESVKNFFNELLRKSVIKNFGGIITLVKGDYQLAKKWYSVKGKYYRGMYINPVKIEFLNKVLNEKDLSNQEINIQIGNSANPSNRHIEALNLLSKFRNGNIKIYVPLSYGYNDNEYIKKVIDEGKAIFKDKFIPMVDFLNPEEYAKYLASIDIAIFGHNRQQALGNIYALLYL
ncbi:TDP-N-acetylfucosamine:lipid II N-acetylfucosaminyltransferase, partial [Bacillus sp. JJ1521]|uniref:TDP-N-acetylfucosamine:lipid II N-acetylfucosaminyltransferase n=1 Tax=Bacillus sp. JJ1521 TaxID=3122957 RepID=UPI002FFDBE63